PRQSAIPRSAEIQGVLAVIVGMVLLFAFVRRELGHPFYGVVAMAAWGVTSSYYECVTWYSASFFTLSLDAALIALLAAQSYRRSGRESRLAACAGACALAPAFHSTALLAGAWCGVYFLFSPGHDADRARTRLGRLATVAPLVGTAAFVAL